MPTPETDVSDMVSVSVFPESPHEAKDMATMAIKIIFFIIIVCDDCFIKVWNFIACVAYPFTTVPPFG